jgi:hypothetical protein
MNASDDFAVSPASMIVHKVPLPDQATDAAATNQVRESEGRYDD